MSNQDQTADPIHTPETAEARPAMDQSQLKAIIEALVFASPEPLTPKMLFKLLSDEPKEDVAAAIQSLQQDYEQDARVKLADLVNASGLDADTTSLQVRYGYPGKVIAATASQLRADLVAIGTRGRSGIEHVLLGSVAEHVLREARGDVLAVPLAGTKFTMP